MKRITIKRISAWSATKVALIYYTAVGLIFGATLLLTVPNGLSQAVIIAIAYPIAGLLVTPLMAWLYNLAAWLTGGLAIEVQESRIITTTTTYEDEPAAAFTTEK
jgi:CBS domain containing-hemolysin-like protein